MTKDELKTECEKEFSNIDRVLKDLLSVYKNDKTDYTITEQAAMASFIVNVYSGIEKVLKQMLVYDKLDTGDEPDWHEKVLKKSAEIGILPPDLFQVLSGYLSFRNYFLYNYIFNINWEEMKSLVDALGDVTVKLRAEIEEYLQTI